MDKPVTRSFIPKKPIAGSGDRRSRNRYKRPIGFALFGWGLFILAIALGGAAYYYRGQAQNRADSLFAQVKERRQVIESNDLKAFLRFDEKLSTSKRLVAEHVAFSNILAYLEEKTVRSVGFTDFALSGRPGGNYSLTLSAIARDYPSFALQSELFRENSSFSRFEYSDIGLNDNRDSVFTIEMTIDNDALRYVGDPVVEEVVEEDEVTTQGS